MIEDGVACVSKTATLPLAAMLINNSLSWIRCKQQALCCEAVGPWEDKSILQLDRPSALTRSLQSSAPCQILSVQLESCHEILLISVWNRLEVCPKKRPQITWTSQLTCLTAPTTRPEPWSTFWTTGRQSSPHTPYRRSQPKKQQLPSTKLSVTLIKFASKQSRRAMISNLLLTSVRSDSISWASPSAKEPSERSNSVAILLQMKR